MLCVLEVLLLKQTGECCRGMEVGLETGTELEAVPRSGQG